MMVSMLTLMSRFPQTYMKSNQYGGSVAGILSAILQITFLSTGGDSIFVALIYFSCGTILIAITTFLAYISYRVPRFQHFLGDTVADTERPSQSWSQMKTVAKRMWPNIVMMACQFFFGGLAAPSIATMVVSENYPHTEWSSKYIFTIMYKLLKRIPVF